MKSEHLPEMSSMGSKEIGNKGKWASLLATTTNSPNGSEMAFVLVPSFLIFFWLTVLCARNKKVTNVKKTAPASTTKVREDARQSKEERDTLRPPSLKRLSNTNPSNDRAQKRRSTDAEKVGLEEIRTGNTQPPLVLLVNTPNSDVPQFFAYPVGCNSVPVRVKMMPDFKFLEDVTPKKLQLQVPKLKKVPSDPKINPPIVSRRSDADYNPACEETMFGIPPVPEIQR
ncbi:hypothetical protein TTRE_0000536101 [Trichuris trichiura]|uniref:Uncharacterized protein n=1 Tax=Trichuris trichiura TaxID=36087 RepID=A0A077ZA14_TRITR|nr:hypothetical protein TTRE_0000536101 [Trichuris trichiura]